MTNFKKAFKKTMKYEGFYSKDPNDQGGETFMGISRVFHPEWSGWSIVDQYKDKTNLENISSLINEVKLFYYNNFWNNRRLPLDSFTPMFNDLKLELFDIAVNMGVFTSALFLQHAINLLNRDDLLFSDIKEDGFVGDKTLSILVVYFNNRQEIDYLIKLIKLQKSRHYINICENNESQEIFIRGWLNRVKF